MAAARSSVYRLACGPLFQATRRIGSNGDKLQQLRPAVGALGWYHKAHTTNCLATSRFFSSDKDYYGPPKTVSFEMAEGVADAIHFYIKFGIPHQRLVELHESTEYTTVQKWQKMMEVFLWAQLHVIAGLGYEGSEKGLRDYADGLRACLDQIEDEELKEIFASIRRDTWRQLVATTFGLKVSDLPSISIVDARNNMHKVASRMMEPDVLLEIQQRCAKINESAYEEPEEAILEKHSIIQNVIVDRVYLGTGLPDGKGAKRSVVDESGLGTGPSGYAKLQCALTEHEGDPLIIQYASEALKEVWKAAGVKFGIGGPTIVPGN